MWGYYLALMGITVSTIMILITNMTTTNQQDYYLLREVTRASMLDSIDFAYYTAYGEPKINTEKFVENFLRRFSEGVSKNNTYKIDFYSIYENPPSVSIKVTTSTGDFNIAGDSTNIDVVNSIDAILESNNTIVISNEYADTPYVFCDESSYISDDPLNPNYGYCRIMVRNKLNFDNNSPFIPKIKEMLEKRGINEEVNINKLEVLDAEFLYLSEDLSETFLKFQGTGEIVKVGEWETGNFANYSGSLYARGYNIASVTGVGYDELQTPNNFETTNVKNVKLGVVKENEVNNGKEETNFYLTYGFDFNCEGANTFKTYRRIQYCKEGTSDCISESLYNGNYYKVEEEISPDQYSKLSNKEGYTVTDKGWYKKVSYCNPLDSSDCMSETSYNNMKAGISGNYIVKIEHLSEGQYNLLSNDEKKKYIKAPYYGACVVGLNYKLDFYYDNAS